jgi:hypothetical protein
MKLSSTRLCSWVLNIMHMDRRSCRSYNNYNLNINPPQYAPPIYGGGYGGYYGGGVPFFGGGVPFFGPTVYVGGGGGLLQFLLIPIILYVVLNIVGSFFRNRD